MSDKVSDKVLVEIELMLAASALIGFCESIDFGAKNDSLMDQLEQHILRTRVAISEFLISKQPYL